MSSEECSSMHEASRDRILGARPGGRQLMPVASLSVLSSQLPPDCGLCCAPSPETPSAGVSLRSKPARSRLRRSLGLCLSAMAAKYFCKGQPQVSMLSKQPSKQLRQLRHAASSSARSTLRQGTGEQSAHPASTTEEMRFRRAGNVRSSGCSSDTSCACAQ